MSDETTKCRVCHRVLRVHESIIRGIGPECARKESEVLQPLIEYEDADEILSAMEERTITVQKIKCPGCGYKCLKPASYDPWHQSECLICKLSKQTYIFDL